jgi:FkbM family methyltransferase
MKQAIQRVARRLGYDIRKFSLMRSESAGVAEMVKSNAVESVIDIGANAGQFALGLRKFGYAGQIVSFEPLPDVHRLLRKNAERDSKWVVAEPMAIGDSEGIISINVAGNAGESSSILKMTEKHTAADPNSAYVGSIQVLSRQLDTVLPELTSSRRLFLKIDVQGFETQVLRGAAKTLDRTIGLQMEMSLVTLYEGQALFLEMLQKIVENGFDLWGFYPVVSDTSTGRMLQCDGIFFRAPDQD